MIVECANCIKLIHESHNSTEWNDKIVVLKKTTLQLYLKTFIEKINSGNLIMYLSWHLFNIAAFSLNQRLELGACLFHKRRRELGEYSADGGDQAGFGVVGRHVGDFLDVWLNEVVPRAQVGGGGEPVREGYKVVTLLLKPSLGLFGLVGRRRVLLPHTGSATGHLIAPGDYHTLQHIQVHSGVDFQADFEDVRWYDVALTWNHTDDHKRNWKLCFYHPGHVPVIRGNPDLYFEGTGNDSVVITCIGREDELYSGVSQISLAMWGYGM